MIASTRRSEWLRLAVTLGLVAAAGGLLGCGADPTTTDTAATCPDANHDGYCDGHEPCPAPNADSDGDGRCDSVDACPGHDDADDFDADGVADGCDPCPIDPLDDSDGDGSCDSEDACPGQDDRLDGDRDGQPDGCDACPLDDPDDSDGDGVCDSTDRCPGQDDRFDLDGDGQPNGCDACPLDNPDDSDGDGVCDTQDACPGHDDRLDADGDGVADACDACPADVADDTDLDGACDSDDPCPLDNPDDTDRDGVCDSDDPCPLDDPDDTDADGVCDSADPCPFDNPDDANGDGRCDSDVAPAPVVSRVSPLAGSVNGGYLVDVVGTGFLRGATVEFGTDAEGWVPSASASVQNAGTLVVALAPPHAEGVVGVRVTNTDLQQGSLPAAFTFQPAPPPPALAVGSLTPARGEAAGGYAVLAAGRGFAPGATVEWGSATSGWVAASSVEVLGPTLLRAVVPAWGVPATVDVRVTVPGFPSAQAVVLGGGFTFGRAVAFEAKGHRLPPDVTTRDREALLFDANGDGRTDVLVLRETGARDDLLLAVPDEAGTARRFVDVSEGQLPSLPGVWATFPRSSPRAVDVDSDGDLDVVFLGYSASDQRPGLYRNAGDGTFTFEDRGSFGFSAVTSLEVADLNCDAHADLFVTRDGQPNRLLVGDGAGGFSLAGATVLPAITGPARAAAIGDVDHDGDDDVVIAYDSAAQTRLFYNNCNNVPLPPRVPTWDAWRFTDAVYGAGRNFPVSGFSSRDVSLADLNGDNWADVVLVNYGQAPRVYMNGGGIFLQDDGLRFPQGEPNTLATWGGVADLDLDGDLDLVLARDQGAGSVWPAVYLNDRAQGGAGAFTAAPANMPAWRGEPVSAVELGDLTGDGLPDLHLVKPDRQDLLLANRGFAPGLPPVEANRVPIGAFADNTLVGLPVDAYATTGCAAGDVDGDGDLDLVTTNAWPGGLRLWVNDGAGNFLDLTAGRVPDVSCNGGRPALVDVNRDGDLDLLVVCSYRSASPTGMGGLRQLVNDGAGQFLDVTAVDVPQNASTLDLVGLGVGGLDANGLADWVAIGNGTVWYTLANGGDPFATDGAYFILRNDWLSWAGAGAKADLLLGDLNGDGRGDAYLAVNGGQSRLWYRDAAGVLTDVTASHLPAIVAASNRVRAADLDLDGSLDLVVAVSGQSRLQLGGADGRFVDVSLSNLPGATGDSRDLALADFDGDGLVDAFLANYAAQDFLWLNAGGGYFVDQSSALPRESDEVTCSCSGDFDGDGRVDLYVGGADVDRVLLNRTP